MKTLNASPKIMTKFDAYGKRQDFCEVSTVGRGYLRVEGGANGGDVGGRGGRDAAVHHVGAVERSIGASRSFRQTLEHPAHRIAKVNTRTNTYRQNAMWAHKIQTHTHTISGTH